MTTDRVVVAYIHPGEVAAAFCSSLVNMVAHNTAHGGANILNGGGQLAMASGANIVTARNKTVEAFLKLDAEWLLLVDADMVLPPDTVDTLLTAAHPTKRPIMGGLCFGVWREQGYDEIFPTLYKFTDNGAVLRLNVYPDNEVMQVHGTGAACLLVHRDVFETMRQKWDPPWPWFAEAIHQGQVMGEDIVFCLRAATCGFPIHVHTGVKVGHIKQRNIDEEAYRLYRGTLVEPSFVVTGTGRSGTGYIAQVLKRLGYNVGHEGWFNPQQKLQPYLIGDSSWLAVPAIESGVYDGIVIWQQRDPLAVLSSLLGGELEEEWAKPYLEIKLVHTPKAIGNPRHLESDMVRFVHHWWRVLIDKAGYDYRLEDLDAQTLRDVCKWANLPVPSVSQARNALEAVPSTYNKHRTVDLTWDDLPDIDERHQLRDWAEGWGYKYD